MAMGTCAPLLFKRDGVFQGNGIADLAVSTTWKLSRQSACMLQLQRKQKTKDGQEVQHQDHFCCTIPCRYCGKHQSYEDESDIKRRESEKHKKAEEEKLPQVGKGIREGGGHNPGRSAGMGNCGGAQTSLAAPTGGRGAANCVLKGEQPGDKWNAPFSPSAGSTEKGENAKKCKLNWHSKCLQAAELEVKFPKEK